MIGVVLMGEGWEVREMVMVVMIRIRIIVVVNDV